MFVFDTGVTLEALVKAVNDEAPLERSDFNLGGVKKRRRNAGGARGHMIESANQAMQAASASASHYHDASALSRLKQVSKSDPQEAAKEVATQFERCSFK